MNRRHVHLRVSWTSTNSKQKHGDVYLYDGGFTFRSSGIELGRGLRPWDWHGSTKSCDRRGGLQRYFDHSASRRSKPIMFPASRAGIAGYRAYRGYPGYPGYRGYRGRAWVSRASRVSGWVSPGEPRPRVSRAAWVSRCPWVSRVSRVSAPPRVSKTTPQGHLAFRISRAFRLGRGYAAVVETDIHTYSKCGEFSRLSPRLQFSRERRTDMRATIR